MVDVWSPDFPLTTFHCRSPRKLAINKIDPSCCIGFYCRTKEDFLNLIETVQPVSWFAMRLINLDDVLKFMKP